MLECRYASSIYYNQENGYTVAVYETEDEIPEGKKEIGKQQFIAVGCELPRNEGLDISLKDNGKNQNGMENSTMWLLLRFRCQQREKG